MCASPNTALPSTGWWLFRTEVYLTLILNCISLEGCLDTLTAAEDLHFTVLEEEAEKPVANRVFSKDDFSMVNRFESKLKLYLLLC